MFNRAQLKGLGISTKDFAIVFNLSFNAFTWAYMVLIIIEGIIADTVTKSTFTAVFYIAASGAGLSGALFTDKIRRLRFLHFWIFLGLLSSSLLMLMQIITTAELSLIFTLLGISFGLGIPSSLAYFADRTNIENRGITSSLILLAANLSVLPLSVLFTRLNSAASIEILVLWRGLGLISLIMLKPKEKRLEEGKKNTSFVSILRQRSFFLYLLPWIMFILIDTLEKALLEGFIGPDFLHFILTAEPVIAVLFTLISGLLGDRIGRKRMVIYGFVSLGIGYAVVGLAPAMLAAWYFYIFVDAAAWGILSTMFLLMLWGDLSEPGNREKYYAVGNFPFFIRSAVPLLLVTFIASVPANAAFSLASFFLFLAVLPLMYAPETLPEKKIELRRVRDYIEKAKKVKDKYVKSDN